MDRTLSRLGRSLAVALAGLLVVAAAASAATFKTGNASVSQSGKALKGVKVSLVRASLSGPVIDMTNGRAVNLALNGQTLTLKAGRKKLNLTNLTINGTKLTGKVGGKTLTFALNFAKAKTSNNAPAYTSESVLGIVANMSKSDAALISKKLKLKGRKKVKTGPAFTVSYSGSDRQLIPMSGSAVLCNNDPYLQKQANDGITVTPISPATQLTPASCSNASGGANFPVALGGAIDTATGGGQIDVAGGLKDTQGSTTASFSSLVFSLVNPPVVLASLPRPGSRPSRR